MTRLFVVTVKNSLIEIFDLKTDKKIGEIEVPNRPHEIVIDNDNKLAYVSISYREGIYKQYSGKGYEIVTIDLNENKIKNIFDLQPNHFNPHGMQIGLKTNYLYVSCESNNGELLKIDTNNQLKIICSIPTQANGPHWFIILPNEKKGYTANKEFPFVSVVDLESNKYLHKISSPFGSENIGCSQNGEFVFLSTLSLSNDMSIVDTQTDTILYNITLNYPPSGFICSPINPYLIYVRHMNVGYDNGFYPVDDGYLQEVNIQTRQIGRLIKTGKNPINILITKDGKQIYLSCGMSHTINIIDLDNMEIIRNISTSPAPHGIIFTD